MKAYTTEAMRVVVNDAMSKVTEGHVEDVDGDAYLQASSRLPVSSPVVRLIVEVNWSAGRLLREYTVFLDPPTVPAAAPALPRIDQRKPPWPPARQESAAGIQGLRQPPRLRAARARGHRPAQRDT